MALTKIKIKFSWDIDDNGINDDVTSIRLRYRSLTEAEVGIPSTTWDNERVLTLGTLPAVTNSASFYEDNGEQFYILEIDIPSDSVGIEVIYSGIDIQGNYSIEWSDGSDGSGTGNITFEANPNITIDNLTDPPFINMVLPTSPQLNFTSHTIGGQTGPNSQLKRIIITVKHDNAIDTVVDADINFPKQYWTKTIDFKEGKNVVTLQWEHITTGEIKNVLLHRYELYIDTKAPYGSFTINNKENNFKFTQDTDVIIEYNLFDISKVTHYKIAEDVGHLPYIGWEELPDNYRINYTLTKPEGQITLYSIVKDKYGHESAVMTSKIHYDITAPTGYINSPENRRIVNSIPILKGTSSAGGSLGDYQEIDLSIDQALGWVDTGIDIASGDKVVITSFPLIVANFGAGLTGNQAKSVGSGPSWLAEGTDLFFIGKIDTIGQSGLIHSTDAFDVGAGVEFTATKTGRLYLSANDGIANFGDNTGPAWPAHIEVKSPALASGILKTEIIIKNESGWFWDGLKWQATPIWIEVGDEDVETWEYELETSRNEICYVWTRAVDKANNIESRDINTEDPDLIFSIGTPIIKTHDLEGNQIRTIQEAIDLIEIHGTIIELAEEVYTESFVMRDDVEMEIKGVAPDKTTIKPASLSESEIINASNTTKSTITNLTLKTDDPNLNHAVKGIVAAGSSDLTINSCVLEYLDIGIYTGIVTDVDISGCTAAYNNIAFLVNSADTGLFKNNIIWRNTTGIKEI